MLYRTCSTCKQKIKLGAKCSKCTNDRNKKYDKFKRDTVSRDFYNSKLWLVVREQVLDKYNYIDIFELKVNKRIVKADTVHHIEPLKDNRDRALDVANLIPVSSRIHKTIHSVYDKGDREKKDMQDFLFKLIGGGSKTNKYKG